MRDEQRMVPVKILYEDNHLLAVEKPVNIPSQADDTGDPDMLTLLKEDLKQRYCKPGNVFLGLVHRLDRPVGGAMIFAKTSKAASRLSEQIRTRKFRKTYLAVVHGLVSAPEGKLEHYLVKDPGTNTVRVSLPHREGAKEAVLEYKVLEYKVPEQRKGDTDQGLSMVKINLHTGRPHQIRVQFSTIGHPLFGDQKYGTGLNKPGQQIALWSYEILCQHPTQKEEHRFVSRPPMVYPWSLFLPGTLP